MVKTKSYTLYGQIGTELDDWLQWLCDTKRIYEFLQIFPNECGVFSRKGTQMRSVKNLESKIEKLYKKGDVVENITLLSLPLDYQNAIFDYIVTLTRDALSPEYITLIFNYGYKGLYNSAFDEEKVIALLKKNIETVGGEIYEMDIDECPESYAGKMNPKEFYKSLNVLRKL